MGNLKKWAGPLSPDWHKQELRLQQRIVARMVELGMRPVLAAFAGIVPDGLARVYPEANITQVSCWNGFADEYTCDHFLDPLDPLFLTVAKQIMQETGKAYGLHHLYSADPWNEQSPSSFAHDYLSAVGRNIYTGMQQVDKQAVWVMQAWMFISDSHDWLANDNARVLIESVPKDRLLLLDLYSEQEPVYTELDGYYGQPYVWNMLHNFGGKDEMRGSVAKVNQGVAEAMNLTNGTYSYVMAGTGLTMEGIYQNYAIYQFAIDRFWSWTEIDTEQWISQYATQRYGRQDARLQIGWNILWVGTGIGGLARCQLALQSTLYEQQSGGDYSPHSSQTLHAVNSGNGHNGLFYMPAFGYVYQFWYDPDQLCNAWNYFVQQSLFYYGEDNILLEHDLVDLSRQVLVLIGINYYYPKIQHAYDHKDMRALETVARHLSNLFQDLDELLWTDAHFMLGPWIEAARAKGANSSTAGDADLYEYNWRNQLTMWGPKAEINDYARKEWAGLVTEYYGKRWTLFIAELQLSLRSGADFDQKAFERKAVLNIERPFTFLKNTAPVEPKGKPIYVAFKLYNKYYKTCRKMSIK